MPPPSRKRRRYGSKVHVEAEKGIHENDDDASNHASPSAIIMPQPIIPHQAKIKLKGEQTRSEVRGPYIHSLCGKGFASRSKVKKHHWGAKLDDLETTTGCWAKNNKPNVSWNEDSSCKEGTIVPRIVKKTTHPMSGQKESEQKAPVAPTMIPMLHDLPQTVVDALTPDKKTQYIPQDINSYHTHRLPTRSRFDSLLTAVNVASRIDAPRPQGCNDSLIPHLDAQAVAAESNRQYVTSWFDACHGCEEEAFTYGYHHPYTANGLGIDYPRGGIHVPLDVALPSQRKNHVYTRASGSPADGNWEHDRAFRFNNSNRNRETLESSFIPNTDTKRQPK
jgi:hypothetical protein